MATRPALSPHPDSLKRQVDVIDHNERVLRGDLEPVQDLAHSDAAEVHVRLRLDEHQLLRAVADLCDFGAKPVAPALLMKSTRQLVHDHEAKVVPRRRVLSSRIPKANDNLHN